LSSRTQFPSKLQLGNKVSHHDAGRNLPRNGTEEDKRWGEFLLHLSGELGFSGSGGGVGLVLRWVMGVKEEM